MEDTSTEPRKKVDRILVATFFTVLVICCGYQIYQLMGAQLLVSAAKLEEGVEDDNLVSAVGKDVVQQAKREIGWHTDGIIVENGISYLIEDLQHLSKRADYINGAMSPYKAIRHFNAELDKKGVLLVVMIVNGKGVGENEGTVKLVKALREGGIEVLSVKGEPVGRYLKHDSHWRPDLLEEQAKILANIVKEMIGEGVIHFSSEDQSVTHQGDLSRGESTASETVTVKVITRNLHEVLSTVMLLGDSYTNIYSDAQLGWGQAAGLAERFSYHLKSACDVLAVNGNGAHASRRELARSVERLDGKKVVVWQFAARELDVKEWKHIDLNEECRSIEPSTVGPRLESYKVLSLPAWKKHSPYPTSITEVLLERESDGAELLVRLLLKKNKKFTSAHQLKVGDLVKLRVTAWEEKEALYKRVEIYGLDRFDLEIQWGEWK